MTGVQTCALPISLALCNEDGTYSGNSSEVINAINCLDYPVEGDTASWQAEAHEMAQVSPTFGADLSYSDLFCQVWGHKSTRERKPIHASGAAPILVIGTTGDPATPYPWAVALAEQLDSGLIRILVLLKLVKRSIGRSREPKILPNPLRGKKTGSILLGEKRWLSGEVDRFSARVIDFRAEFFRLIGEFHD